MRLGVILPALVEPRDVPNTLHALDAWVARAGKAPDFAPVWSTARDGEAFPLSVALLSGLRAGGIEPVVYAAAYVPFADILAGRYDRDLSLLGCRAEGLVVRWCWEPDGDWGMPYQSAQGRALYVETWHYVRRLLMAEGGVRMFWCPTSPDRAVSLGLFPGPAAVDVIGFDRFSRDDDARWPPLRPISQVKALAPGKPICIGETGREANLPGRAKWLRDIEQTPDVEAIAVFDMLVEVPPNPPNPAIRDDWRWSSAMYRTWATL